MTRDFRKATQAEEVAYKKVISSRVPAGVSWYGWGNDKYIWFNNYTGCHSQILAGRKKDTKVFFSAVKGFNRCSKERLDMLRFLLDPTVSPWRSVVPRQSIITEDGTDLTSINFIRRYGFIWSDLDVPANVAVGLWIAAGRWAYETPKVSIDPWIKLRNEGVHPTLALFFRPYAALRGEDKESFPLRNAGFHGEQVPYAAPTMEQYENFINGKIVNPTENLLKAPHYNPTIQVWGEFPRIIPYDALKKLRFPEDHGGSFHNYLLDTYPELVYIENTYKSRPDMAYYYARVYVKSYKALLEIIFSEQERLGLKNDWDPSQWEKSGPRTQAASHVEQDAKAQVRESRWDRGSVPRDELGRFAPYRLQVQPEPLL